MVKNESIVAANIRSIIKKSGLKQYAVAEKAGYTGKAFSDMLNGRKTITAEHITPIAKSLSSLTNTAVTPNDLLGL